MPDSEEVWRAAELLEDFKGPPCKLKILYEEAEVILLREYPAYSFVLVFFFKFQQNYKICNQVTIL